MRNAKIVLMAAALTAGVAGASVAVANGADDGNSTAQSTAHGSATPPGMVRQALDDANGAAAPFGVSSTNAYRVTTSRGTAVWVAPGTDGSVCMAEEDGVAACGTAADVEAGRLTLAKTDERPRFVDGKLVTSPGHAAEIVGYVGTDVTSATILGKDDARLAQASVSNGVYEARIADDLAAVHGIRLADGDTTIRTMRP